MRACLVAAVFTVLIPTGVVRAVAAGQTADPRISLLIDQASKAGLALRFDDASARIDEAIALAERTGDRVGLATTHRVKGTIFNQRGHWRDAAVWHERALAEFEALGHRHGMAAALAGLTTSAAGRRDTVKVREYGARALQLYEELGDDRGRAYVLSSFIYSGAAPDLDEKRIEEILEVGERLSDDALKARARRSLGVRQFNAGNLAGARASYEGAIAAYEKSGDIESLAACYLNLGRVFRAHGDYEGALTRYQKAIDLLAPTKERFTIVEAVNSSAVALLHLKRNKDAIAAYERGLALARESGSQQLIDFMEGNLAGGLVSAGEYARAIPALEAAIARKPEPSLLGYRYHALAQALAQLGRVADALVPNSEAIRLARETSNVDSLLPRLDDRVWMLSKLGRLEEALTDAREVMTTAEQIRGRLIPSDFLKRGYGERVQQGYKRIVELLSRLDRGAEALDIAEQGRARAFLDLLAARESADSTLPTRGETPGSATTSRGDVASELAARPVAIGDMRQIAGRLGTTIVSYWVNDDATIIWVVRPDTEPAHIRVPVTRDRLTALVSATTAPLRETARAATTRGVDAGESGAAPLATAEDLAALPLRGLGLLALRRDDKAAWRELYASLIAPVRAQLPARGDRLTIVPHGPLFQLSFAALQSSTGRYLIEDYELHYSPAVSALEYTGRRQQAIAAQPIGPWAIVGNPAALPAVGTRPLPPLPGAAREIASIASLAPKDRRIRLDGAGASERALVDALERSRPSVLHFATHGFVFDDPKVLPFLALDRRGTAEAEDGRLTLDEVYRLTLSTDLVVLSACRTGSGQVSSDGIVGLTRGFFYAGTPSVMATFWDVADETTAILMSGFYRSYAKAHAKSRSLRSAQLTLLANLRAGKVIVTASGRRVTLPEHPLLWAAFFLSGEP